MIFAIIESKSAGMVSPSLTPVSTRMPGPAGSASRAMRPGAGAKSRSGSSALSRASMACPDSAGLSPSSLPAGRHVQLKPDQVGAGGQLGDRVLDLEPGVDLEEGEPLLPRVVEELDGRRAPVADREGQPLGRRLQLGDLLGREDRGADSSMTFWLRRCTEQSRTPERPGGALPVGDHLDLDVPGAGDQPLQEHGAAAERAQRLGAGPLERLGEVGRARRSTRMPRPPPPAVAFSISG